DIEQLVLDSINSSDAGISAALWQDEEAFGALVSHVYENAGCPLPADLDGPALHSNDGTTNYCGPGHGRGKLFVPTVNPCINQLCREHDACYSMCNQPLTEACYWSPTTQDCDDPFIDAIEQCEIVTHWFASNVVIVIASLMNAQDNAGCPSVECPTLGEMGSGPCSLSLLSNSCATCLDNVDLSSCRTACDGDDQPEICIAANCPVTTQCFGGYGYGAVPPVQVSDGGTGNQSPSDASVDGGAVAQPSLPDGSDLFTMTLLSGVMPALKPNGAVWDGSPGDSFVAPDANVLVTLENTEQTVSSGFFQDEFEPVWNQVMVTLSAAEIPTLKVEVIDIDAVFDDQSGSCYLPMDVLWGLSDGPMTLSCDPIDLTLTVQFEKTL
ncbi:MAG TPA: hypothetical protein VHO25_02010, partial [Polyangiaceae bacterium]|nr:hypothetical protein [Polyangiaceae bacterium]